MTPYRNLTLNIWLYDVLAQMPSEDLYKFIKTPPVHEPTTPAPTETLVQASAGPDEIKIEPTTPAPTKTIAQASAGPDKIKIEPTLFLRRSIETLFDRTDKVARDYQNSLIVSWIHHWSLTPKLSFIQSQQDVSAWIARLATVLTDPNSSFTYKVRASLLINKLLPKPVDTSNNLPAILTTVLQQGKSVHPSLEVSAAAFSQSELLTIIKTLIEKSDAPNIDQYKSIACLGPFLEKTTLDTVIPLLRDSASSIDALQDLAPFMTDNQKKSLSAHALSLRSNTSVSIQSSGIKLLLATSSPPDTYEYILDKAYDQFTVIDMETLKALVKVQTNNEKIHPTLQKLMDLMKHERKPIRYRAICTLNLLIPQLKENAHINTVLDALIDILNDECNTVGDNGSQEGLLLLTLDAVQLLHALTRLMNKSQDKSAYSFAYEALIAFAPTLNVEQSHILLSRTLNVLSEAASLLKEFAYKVVLALLPKISPESKNDLFNKIFTQFTQINNKTSSSTRSSLTAILKALSSGITPDQNNLLFDHLIDYLENRESTYTTEAIEILHALLEKRSKDDIQRFFNVLIALPFSDHYAQHTAIMATFSTLATIYYNDSDTAKRKMFTWCCANLQRPHIHYLDFADAANTLIKLIPITVMPDFQTQNFLTIYITKINNHDENIRDHAWDALNKTIPLLNLDMQSFVYDSLGSQQMLWKFLICLNTLMPDAVPNEKRIALCTDLLPLLQDKDEHIRKQAKLYLCKNLKKLTEPMLTALATPTDVPTFEKLGFVLIAQTQLELAKMRLAHKRDQSEVVEKITETTTKLKLS